MKRILSLILIMAMLTSLGACGSQGETGTTPDVADTTETPIVAPSGEDADTVGNEEGEAQPTENNITDSSEDVADGEDDGSLGSIEADKGLFNVTLTISAEFFGDTTQEELDAAVDTGKYKSATLNDDGSVTIVMSKSQHKELVEYTTTAIDEGLQDLPGSETYPNIVSIDHNKDFTEFTVTTKSESLDMSETFSTLLFYLYGGMYNAFAGNTVDNINVKFINEATGEVIKEANSADMES